MKCERVRLNLFGDLAGVVFVEVFLRLFNKREDVAEVENSTRHSVGVEGLECVEAFPSRGENDGPIRQSANRECCATTSITVEFGQHNPREVDAVLEGLGGDDRVLADHRVENEQDLVGVGCVADRASLAHEVLVDTESSRGVDDDRVVKLLLRVLHAVLGDRNGISLTVARLGGENLNTRLFRDDRQLRDGVGALEVTRDENGGVPLRLEVLGEFPRKRRLTRALKSSQHDDGRRGLGKCQLCLSTTEYLDEFLVDNLNNLLCRIERFIDIVRQRTIANLPRERFDDIERHVGLE